ncbi:hypothetical protein [Parafrankia sp. EAN1pec]|uniref:hypothetical protein n=1 Tax=Parafrankia sp. (strain EAN1pec) TaxID=298653 RepID=UPI0002DCF4C6
MTPKVPARTRPAMAMARRIARQDTFALRMAKGAVHHTLDVQGFTTAVDAVFEMHHLGHARAAPDVSSYCSVISTDSNRSTTNSITPSATIC